MKVSEINAGDSTTLTLQPRDGPPQSIPAREEEVVLVHSANQVLLRYRDEVYAVEGVTSADTTRLKEVLESALPLIAYVAQASDERFIIEALRLPQEMRITEPMEIGLDDKVMDDIRRSHRVGGTVADVTAWLEDRLFISNAPGETAGTRRMVVSGGGRDKLDAFRVHGLRVSADIRRIDNRLRIERIVRGGMGSRARLTLLHANVSVVDATAAAEMHGAVRTTLSEAVAGSGSYLRVWQEYQSIEREGLQQRARTLGAHRYTKRERIPNGDWLFQIEGFSELRDSLDLIGESERFELEAGAMAPRLDTAPSTKAEEKKVPAPNIIKFRGAIKQVKDNQGVIILAGPDEDDDLPKPPDVGYLYLATGGDLARQKRRERAEEALRTGNCPLPQLGLLMEGHPAPAARRSRVSLDGPRLKKVVREVFGESGPTQRQREAIEIALNTPDVCLIQGPPGTGKTKVITAIEKCLAVLAEEGIEPSHRILVTAAQHDAVENVAERTEVFGLPAVKIGKRARGSDTVADPVQRFVDERLEQLRLRQPVPTEAERLDKARNIVISCTRSKSLPREQGERIHNLIELLDEFLPPTLRDKALERASQLERPQSKGDSDENEQLLKAARAIRVDAITFSDDGPIKARIALKRLNEQLTAEERVFLERCISLEPEETPDWLEEGKPLRDALIDRLLPNPTGLEQRLDQDTQALLLELLDSVEHRLAAGRYGEDATLAAYLQDLESDPEGVRDAIAHYTVVLAATLQQAAGGAMRRVRGIDEGQTTFESVIVDEAARANPLDLFIPLSMAKRRVVLVGDHRQLPHLLEPDVERQMTVRVEQGEVESEILDAIKASLFERLWVLLRKLEEKDSIRRTVTLNAQYRMHPILGAYVSREFYEYHGDGAIESPRPAEQFSHNLPAYLKEGKPCVAAWLDVPYGRGNEVPGTSKHHPSEARAIAEEVRRLIDHDTKLTFGIIAFYSAQVDEIGMAMIETGLTERANNVRGWRIADAWSTTLNHEGKMVERLRIGTVDAFQGKEFDVVLLSVTRSNNLPADTDIMQRRKYGHLMLENRLCVAMSRQQRLLIVAGNREFVMEKEATQPLRALRVFSELCGGKDGVVR